MTSPVMTLLTLEQVASLLEVPRKTVVRFIKSGELKAFHVSCSKTKPRIKDWRVTAEDLDEWRQTRILDSAGAELVEIPLANDGICEDEDSAP